MLRFKFVFILFMLLPALVFPGTTGKIAGKVTDSQSGEALAGVNVFLQGTAMGAATDIDGFYYIINVPPGTYTMQFAFVGYAEFKVTNVEVAVDLTTKQDVELLGEDAKLNSDVVA